MTKENISWKGQNDHRKYFMIYLHERMLPDLEGIEPLTSWLPVGCTSERIRPNHWGPLHCSLAVLDKNCYQANYSYFNTKTCYTYSSEAAHWGTSNEYPQHTFSWRNMKTFLLEKSTLSKAMLSGQIQHKFSRQRIDGMFLYCFPRYISI